MIEIIVLATIVLGLIITFRKLRTRRLQRAFVTNERMEAIRRTRHLDSNIWDRAGSADRKFIARNEQ